MLQDLQSHHNQALSHHLRLGRMGTNHNTPNLQRTPQELQYVSLVTEGGSQGGILQNGALFLRESRKGDCRELVQKRCGLEFYRSLIS